MFVFIFKGIRMGKLRKLYEEVLSEGSSQILYHFTRLNRLENILNNDSFYLTPAVSKSEKTNGRDYFMSFTRSKSTKLGYGTKFDREDSVRVIINGQKLGSRYKIAPIDYWQYPKTPESMLQTNSDEMEDRLVSNTNEIPNASKYITQIDIMMGSDGVPKSIIDNANKLGIKINIYDDVKEFGKSSNKVVKPIINNDEKSENQGNVRFMSGIMSVITYNDKEMYIKLINGLEDLGYGDTIGDIKEMISRGHEKLKYNLRPNDEYSLEDLVSSLGADLHNNKTNSDKVSRFVVKLYLEDIRTNKIKNNRDYLLYKLYKNKKTQKDFNEELSIKVISVIDNLFTKLKEDLNYEVREIETDNYGPLYQYGPVSKLLEHNIKMIKKYLTDLILNDKEMFKFTYMWSPRDIMENIDLTNKVGQAISGLENVDSEDINWPFKKILYEVSNFIDNEVEKIKEEDRTQWGGQ